jgi:chromosome segregation ATPase
MESQQYQNEFPDVELENIEPSLYEKLHNVTQIHQDIENMRKELTEEYKKSKNAFDEIEKRIDILNLRFNRGLIEENEYKEQLKTLEKQKENLHKIYSIKSLKSIILM